MDSYAIRPHTAQPSQPPQLPLSETLGKFGLGGEASDSDGLDSHTSRLSGSANALMFAHSPPSPPRRYESDFRADYRHLPRSRHGDPALYRPSTSSSSSSYYGSLPTYSSGLARQYSLGGRPVERRDSFWDNGPHVTSSPVPYSPPPTAQTGVHGHDKRKDDYGAPFKRRRKEHDLPLPDSAVPGAALPEDRPKTSHLPPSLAALAIARPLDHGTENRSGPQLPGLALRIDGDSPEIARPATGEWPRRDYERDYRDRREHFGKDNLADPRLGPDGRLSSAGAIKDEIARPAEMTNETSAPSSLPRFNEMFR
jgi:hypothetical protein